MEKNGRAIARDEAPMTVHQALSRVMREVGAIAKTDKNTSQGFNFRGIDSVVNAVSPALQRYGVVVIPTVETYEYNTVEIGRNRTAMGHVKLKVSYTFVGSQGDALKATVVGEAMDSGDKATAKAMSVAFRTALLQSLALPTHDTDPDAQSYERSPAFKAMAPSAILLKISQAITIEQLADIGQYITENKNNYDEEMLSQFREKFKDQQLMLKPLVEETVTSNNEKGDTYEVEQEGPNISS